VLRAYVEPQLLKRLRQISVRAQRAKDVPDLTPIRAEQEAIETSLARLAALYAEGELPEGEYRRAADMQRRKLARVTERLQRATRRAEDSLVSGAIGDTRLTPQLWGLLPADVQQSLYRLAIERIIVYPRPAPTRIEVVWR